MFRMRGSRGRSIVQTSASGREPGPWPDLWWVRPWVPFRESFQKVFVRVPVAGMCAHVCVCLRVLASGLSLASRGDT